VWQSVSAVMGTGSIKGCRVSTFSILIHRDFWTILSVSCTGVVVCDSYMVALWSRKYQCFDALSRGAVEVSRCPSCASSSLGSAIAVERRGMDGTEGRSIEVYRTALEGSLSLCAL
jgi:hypothetical protein